jgi:hypothetical protein
MNEDGNSELDEQQKEELLSSLRLINSNLDKREHELMRIFDCKPTWPICLYDFTFKNRSNKYIAMRSRLSLKDFVVENYFKERGPVNKKAKYSCTIEETDIVRELSMHLCCCQDKNTTPKDNQRLYKFIRNFKILFIKGDPFLLKNSNLKF